MTVAADAPDPDAFSFEILRTFNVWLTHNAVGENVFNRADKNKIGIASKIGPHGTFAADNTDIPVATAHRRRDDARRRDVDELKVEIVLCIQPRLLGKPGQCHSDARRRLQADELLGRKSRCDSAGNRQAQKQTSMDKKLAHEIPLTQITDVITTILPARTTLTRLAVDSRLTKTGENNEHDECGEPQC